MSHKEFFAQQCGTYIRNVGIEKYKYVLKLFLNKVALFEELIKIVNTQKTIYTTTFPNLMQSQIRE